MTSAELYELFRKKWDGPDKSTFYAYEVRNAAGFDAGRSCDALSVGTWPSRGLFVDGYEFKVSRSDWLKELSEPAKAEAFFHFCDRWWIVAGHESIVQNNELPAGWGLIVADGKKLTIRVQASKNENPKPWSRSFRAAVVKRFAERGMEIVTKERSKIRAEIEQEFEKRGNEDLKFQKELVTRLTQKIEHFEKTTGVRIEGWQLRENPGRIKQAVALIDRGGVDLGREVLRFRELADHAERLRTDLLDQATRIEKLYQGETSEEE